jgi:hypothetical protein
MDQKEFQYRQEIADIFVYNIMRTKKIILINNISLNKKYE